MAFSTAFQRNAFQNNAFQIDTVSGNIGARIVGGTFARRRWIEIKETQRRARQAAIDERERERLRKRRKAAQEAAERRAAREAVRLAQDQANAEAAVQRMLVEALRVGSAAQGLSNTMTDALAMQAMAREAARKAQQDDEEEAIALLLLS